RGDHPCHRTSRRRGWRGRPGGGQSGQHQSQADRTSQRRPHHCFDSGEWLMKYLLPIALLALSAGYADSLYTPTSGFKTLFADRKAVAVGDVLHVLVTETAQANQTVNNSTASSTAA